MRDINGNWFDAPYTYVDDTPTRKPRRPHPDNNDPHTWTSADGRKIPIHELSDRHLLNTIAYVERSFRELQDTFCDDAIDIDRVWPQHGALLAEGLRRGLVKKDKRPMVTG